MFTANYSFPITAWCFPLDPGGESLWVDRIGSPGAQCPLCHSPPLPRAPTPFSSEPRFWKTKSLAAIPGQRRGSQRAARGCSRSIASKRAPEAQQDNLPTERRESVCSGWTVSTMSSAALLHRLDKWMCQRARRCRTGSHTHIRTRERQKRHPTWLEHTLEIKDDQNKGSQTSGKYHPAYPAHPHQFSQSLFHGGRGGWGGGAARSVRGWKAPGLCWYWWGLFTGQWAGRFQHGAYPLL